MRSRSFFPGLLLLLAPPVLAQNVLVVDDDGGPGVDHTTLTAALAAAVSGDVLVVRDGAYALASNPPTLVTGKALTIAAQGSVDVEGSLEARLVPAGGTFTVRGLRSAADALSFRGFDSPGRFWLEACDLGTAVPGPFQPTAPCRFASCASLLLERSHGFGAGLQLDSTPFHAFRSSLTAEDFGEAGVALIDSVGFAARSTFLGAHPAFDVQLSGSSLASLLDCVAPNVTAGVTIVPGSASFYEIVEGVAVEGTPITLRVQGPPGTFALCAGSRTSEALWVPAWSGTLALGPLAFGPVALGTIPASGLLERTVTVPSLPTGVEAEVVYTQLITVAAGEGVRLGGASALVVLDDGL